MKREYIRHVVVFEEHFKQFRKTLDRETLKKVYQVLTLIMMVETIPAKFLKPIAQKKGLYEIRIEQAGNIYRIFCCFDKDKLVILLNGFQKKTKKTPPDQMDKAEALMKKYFYLKNKKDNEE